ncbi:hypothetical protein COLO4_38164 [Corchorus olitorius]|uniref:Uncharacterized protein n=1 Tax=Corchorus olitorius TaxID=93759 RepID=A0A1R3FWM3_9ROSI|nr:hypothetical protein COLO4_38164 [Corchorus olitorius]
MERLWSQDPLLCVRLEIRGSLNPERGKVGGRFGSNLFFFRGSGVNGVSVQKRMEMRGVIRCVRILLREEGVRIRSEREKLLCIL